MRNFITRPVHRALTVGARLRRARRARKLSLEEVELKTLIRRQYLEQFENDDVDHLPADVYALGFLERYARFLHLKEDSIIEQFRSSRALLLPREAQLKPEHSVKEMKILITPRLFIATSVTLSLIGLFIYISLAVRHFTARPTLELRTPSEIITSEKVIAVEGLSDEAATVTINREPIALNGDGSFSQEVALHEGVNIVEVIATNRTQKETRKTLTIFTPDSQ